MNKIYTTLLALAFGFVAGAQSLSPTVISSTGGFSQNANGSLSYTVGEMTMVQTFSANGNILTQGFQQPNDNVVGLIDITKDEFGSFVVYPNPAVDNLFFGYQFPEEGRVNIKVYDVLGQIIGDIHNSNYSNGKTVETYTVSNLAAGMYYMSLTFTSSATAKTYLISKQFQVIN
ncbi:MAG: T9SS type A sorting domain-containing protein [Bacteroidetes bacterium]|nr:T9SS type A sorting domain-containing protein [Bacteroidota bacterium]